MRYNQGEKMWQQRYCRDREDIAFAILQTPDGGFAMAGRSGSFAENWIQDFFLHRVDSLGEHLWETSFDADDGGDQCFSLIQTDNQKFVLFGKANIDGEGHSSCYLVKTGADPVSVPYLIDPAYPSDFTVEAAYPNPFNGMVTIPYRLTATAEVKVTVYDSFGREVSLLVSDYKQSGSHEIIWLPESVPSGTYMVSVGFANSTSMVPVVLVK